MKSCYNCASSPANYTGYVQTGYSISNSFGKKTTSSSVRTYYGRKSFCESCAASMAENSAKSSAAFAILVFCILLIYLIFIE
jgi:hypothetical protein